MSQTNIQGLAPVVVIYELHWTKKGHGGLSKQVDYTIYLNCVRLRGFSTHGDMQEGYWGGGAEREAKNYAEKVAKTLGVDVLRPGTQPPKGID